MHMMRELRDKLGHIPPTFQHVKHMRINKMHKLITKCTATPYIIIRVLH